ncbi:MAG: hypothetical protein AAF502_21620 [Bacteroidota bacterium]
MEKWKYITLFLGLMSLGCNAQKEDKNYSESMGDVSIVGQKKVDVTVTPDKINGTLLIMSRPNDPVVDLSGMSPYENLKGVSHTKEITGDLYIKGNQELADLSPLDSLIVVGNMITIIDNPKVSNLDFISSINSFKGIKLTGINISNLEFLKTVKTLEGNFGLGKLDRLTEFTPLPLEKAKGLFLDALTHMKNTDFLSNLNTISGAIYFTNNPALENITLNIKNPTLNSNLNISSNEALTTVEGLENVVTLNQGLTIIDNIALENLNFLSGVKRINGNLRIRGNSKLVDFSGLSNIESVTGAVQIEDNGAIDTETYGQILAWQKKWKSGTK